MGEGATPRPRTDLSRPQKTNAIRSVTASHRLILAVSAITHPSHCHHMRHGTAASARRLEANKPPKSAHVERAQTNIQTT